VFTTSGTFVVICDTYSITVNQVMVATVNIFEVMTSTLPKGTLNSGKKNQQKKMKSSIKTEINIV